jgi:PAS domain S-box-containing protein
MTKILIVDDEKNNLYLLQVLLSSNGYTLISASNGAEALDLARQVMPDVIISDILMPVMDGFSLCRACKEDERLRDIPFIFYTATYTDYKDEELALSLGAEQFIVKPTEPAQFLDLLKRTVEKFAAGQQPARQTTIDDPTYYKEYNAVLIHKLEDKVAQLEETNRKLELDIQVRKQAEDALLKSKNNYATLVGNASVGVYQANLDGTILFANQELARIGNFESPADLIGSKILIHYKHPQDHTRMIEILKQELRVWNLETELLTRDGHTRTVLLNASLDDSTITGMVNDITERKQAEEKIRQQTSRAQALVHTAAHINSSLKLDAVLDAVCEETARALDVPCVAINLVDMVSQTVSFVATYGLSPMYRQKQLGMPLASFGSVAAQTSDDPMVVLDLKTNPVLSDAALDPAFHFRTFVSTRIVNNGVLLGRLNVITLGQVRHFSDDELVLLQGLSNQAAQAITNAHLFERTARHLKYIEALHTIDVAIANSLDVCLTLKMLVEEVIRQLEVDAVSVLLFKPATHTLEFTAGQGFRTTIIQKVKLRLGEGLAGRAALDKRQYHIPNLADFGNEITHSSLFNEEGFLAYYGIPLYAKEQIIGVLEIFHRTPLHPDEDWTNFLETLSGQAAIAIDSAQSFEKLQHSNIKLVMAYDATIEGWSRAMDLRDNETEGHTQRVTQLAVQLAREMGISEEEIIHVRRGALLHDMGKLGIPDSILLKPDKLTPKEWGIMHQHPQYAYDMLSSIEYLRPALVIPYCHHEKWDGSGYPEGLKGEQIPLAARVFAVVDVWDALTSDRPYRKAWSRQQTLDYIREQTGKHFDPQVAQTLLAIIGKD